MRRAFSLASLLLLGLGACADDPAAAPPNPEAGGSQHGIEPSSSPPASPEPEADQADLAKPDAPEPALARDDTTGIAVWPARPKVSPHSGAHIYSKSRHLWIRPAPRDGGGWLGYLSLGDAIRVKGGSAEDARVGPGSGRFCQTWYAVEPVGFVCAGDLATLDPDDPEIVELRRRAADRTSPWPYDYAESLDAPVYLEPPSPKVQRGREYALDKHLAHLAEAKAADDAEAIAAIDKRLVGVDLTAAGKTDVTLLPGMPPHGRPNQNRIYNGSTLAFVDSFDHADRSFLVTWDGGIVPKDKVRPYPESSFHGVILGPNAELPIAFMRVADQTRFERQDGRMVASDRVWPRLTAVALTGETVEHDAKRYWAATDGAWLEEGEAAIAQAAGKLPRVVANAEAGATWLDVSILGGTMVAYEGLVPVYATMISPGRGGMPRRDVPTLETASTPTGTFSVLGKFVTATMQSSSIATLVHSEVQYTMNFSGPYAVHGAYWHDRFGEPKSGGCVNLSPIDAQRIFEWSQPRLPEGWHGMRTLPKSHDFGRPTFVHLHR
jgi:L,D-transpeptidase catalytic domain